MNASDPVDLAEVAKSQALSHDVAVNEKTNVSVARELSIEESDIVPAPTAQPSTSLGHETEDVEKPYPTDDDFQNLRRVAGSLPWTTFTVALVELCERFSY